MVLFYYAGELGRNVTLLLEVPKAGAVGKFTVSINFLTNYLSAEEYIDISIPSYFSVDGNGQKTLCTVSQLSKGIPNEMNVTNGRFMIKVLDRVEQSTADASVPVTIECTNIKNPSFAQQELSNITITTATSRGITKDWNTQVILPNINPGNST